jgi:hypothetical protein
VASDARERERVRAVRVTHESVLIVPAGATAVDPLNCQATGFIARSFPLAVATTTDLGLDGFVTPFRIVE